MSTEFIKKSQASNTIVDVHHHVFPPCFLDKFKNYKFQRDPSLPAPHPYALFLDGKPPPTLTEEGHLEFMKKSGITYAITSITTEETTYDLPIEEQTAYLNECNTFQMNLVKKHPKNFGAFLNFPLTDTNKAIEVIREIKKEYTDKYQGYMLPAQFNRDEYLGDARFEPIYEELNKDGTVIFIHPVTEIDRRTGQMSRIHQCIADFVFQTTRSIITLYLSGAFTKYPNVKWIFPHMGGTFPFIAHRMELFGVNEDIYENLYKYKNVYFDSAGAFSKVQWHTDIKSSQILTGSDAPYQHIAYPRKKLGEEDDQNDGRKTLAEINIDIIRNKEEVCYKNAFTLFPQLKALLGENESNK